MPFLRYSAKRTRFELLAIAGTWFTATGEGLVKATRWAARNGYVIELDGTRARFTVPPPTTPGRLAL